MFIRINIYMFIMNFNTIALDDLDIVTGAGNLFIRELLYNCQHIYSFILYVLARKFM